MNPEIKITRYPYEEPYHLNLIMEVSNGVQASKMEFYINTDSLTEIADSLEKFPTHKDQVFL